MPVHALAAVEAEAGKKATSDGGDCLDLPTLIRRCMDDRELAAMLLERFSSRLDSTVRDIGQLLAAQKWAEATSALHSLKGEAGSLAIEGLHTACAALEEALRQSRYDHTTSQFHEVQRWASTCLAGAPSILERLGQAV